MDLFSNKHPWGTDIFQKEAAAQRLLGLEVKFSI